jgi:hypothetical protein
LGEDATTLPTLAKDEHPKISNGSVLIEIGCSEVQGRYLQVNSEGAGHQQAAKSSTHYLNDTLRLQRLNRLGSE